MSDSNTQKSLYMFNNGREICAGLPFTPGLPVRLSGEIAAKLDAQTSSGDLLTRGFCSGTIASHITLEQEPERGSCLITVLDSQESGDLLLNFAATCAEAALVRRAGGAYYQPPPLPSVPFRGAASRWQRSSPQRHCKP